MNDKMPTGRLSRTLSSGKMAAKIGGNEMRYMMKRPFLSSEKQKTSRQELDRNNAKILFTGLSMLKGTALKAAQMLSFERELLPDAFHKELEKSYFQVPPINRALVRKIIKTGLGEAPEKAFSNFDSKAFAAASLGQVHRACSPQGDDLAVKIQYPDMKKTIDGDIRMLTAMVRPMADYDLIKAALDEIRDVLIAETDYCREAKNIEHFRAHLNLERVKIPRVYPDLSTGNILSMSYINGQILSQWLKTGPGQSQRNHVAQTLNDIFIRGFYELNMIHADPNPGNFLVLDNLELGLLDFGCVRNVRLEFTEQYRALIRLGGTRDRSAYQNLLESMNFIHKDLAPQHMEEVLTAFMDFGAWINKLFRREDFDFGSNPDFMSQGHRLGRQMQKMRRHMKGFPPEFVFLDRTRYGLIRIYEQMGVKIRLRNEYEYNDAV